MENFSCQICVCHILDCKYIFGLIAPHTAGKANYLRCGSKVEFPPPLCKLTNPYLWGFKVQNFAVWPRSISCCTLPWGRLRPFGWGLFPQAGTFSTGGPLFRHRGIVDPLRLQRELSECLLSASLISLRSSWNREPFLWSRASLAAPSGQLALDCLPPTPSCLLGAKRAEERDSLLALCQVFSQFCFIFVFHTRKITRFYCLKVLTIQALT